MTEMSRYLFYCAALFLAACAGPVTDVPSAGYGDLSAELRAASGVALDEYVTARQRLYHVAMPLYYANAGLCPKRFMNPGFTVYSDFDVPTHLQNAAIERKNLGRAPVVLAVAGPSDAFDKGVRAGDVLMLINGVPVANSAQANARFKKIKDTEKPVTLGFLRDGVAYSVSVKFEPTCYYPIDYAAHDVSVNAGASGQRIEFNKGMVDFANDSELAVVMGHELAHNIMHHGPKDTQNMAAIRVMGAVVDGVIGMAGLGDTMQVGAKLMLDTVWSQAYEREADYVGLYLLARANGDIGAAAPFWRRMAVQHNDTVMNLPAGPDFTRSHPVSAERFVILRNTETEITAKRAKGERMMPNLKSHWNFGERYAWWDVNHAEGTWESGDFGND